MLECYYRQCQYHEVTEPFCTLDKCIATKVDLEVWEYFREQDLRRGERWEDEPSS